LHVKITISSHDYPAYLSRIPFTLGSVGANNRADRLTFALAAISFTDCMSLQSHISHLAGHEQVGIPSKDITTSFITCFGNSLIP
jgi:hypothetical protein